nr:MAG TPA: Replication associated protein [Microviridae sp.]
MACYKPLTAWQTVGGEVVFAERGNIQKTLTLPCGRCVGCRLERARQWSIRIMHEAQVHQDSSFVTLTYDEDKVPKDGSLKYRDFQTFIKRLRRSTNTRIRYYMCGEYGDQLGRPHFHAAIFGEGFRENRTLWKKTDTGNLYRAEKLEKLWPHGYSTVGELTIESAGYIARYVMKKINGRQAWEHYKKTDPETGEIIWLHQEYAHMSLKPGIGGLWYEKYRDEVYPQDRVIGNGVPQKPPRYYDKLERRRDEELMEGVLHERVIRPRQAGEETDERLSIRERVVAAKLTQLKRKLK